MAKKGIVDGEGIDCPRCQRPSQRYVHKPDFKPAPGRGFYRFWFECTHADCRTGIFMTKDAYVVPGDTTGLPMGGLLIPF